MLIRPVLGEVTKKVINLLLLFSKSSVIKLHYYFLYKVMLLLIILFLLNVRITGGLTPLIKTWPPGKHNRSGWVNTFTYNRINIRLLHGLKMLK